MKLRSGWTGGTDKVPVQPEPVSFLWAYMGAVTTMVRPAEINS